MQDKDNGYGDLSGSYQSSDGAQMLEKPNLFLLLYLDCLKAWHVLSCVLYCVFRNPNL